MKEVLEKILSYLPVYIPDLVRIISGPKRFVAGHIKRKGELVKAFTFFGVSLSIFFLLQADITVRGRGFTTDFIVHGILYLLSVAIFTVVLRLSWRIVGGRADYQGFLIATLYYVGVLFVGIAIAALCFTGVLRMFYPNVYTWFIQYLAAPNLPNPNNLDPTIARGILVAFLGFLTVAVLTLGWGLAGWGAYREMNKLSRPRSCAALFLTMLIFLPVSAGLFIAGWH
ncbi:MAG TPA: hypothetical protein VKD70_15850 [Candidatus Acidoferrum sp.]|nr:hypothetical protein [Candidatus Acidoferrum sp.]